MVILKNSHDCSCVIFELYMCLAWYACSSSKNAVNTKLGWLLDRRSLSCSCYWQIRCWKHSVMQRRSKMTTRHDLYANVDSLMLTLLCHCYRHESCCVSWYSTQFVAYLYISSFECCYCYYKTGVFRIWIYMMCYFRANLFASTLTYLATSLVLTSRRVSLFFVIAWHWSF